VISLQDQKLMHQYFTDLLFQPLAEQIAETLAVPVVEQVQTTVVEEFKNTIELLPLPNTKPDERFEINDYQVVPAPDSPLEELQELDTKSTTTNSWQDDGWENQHPPWAQAAFDCLLFEVCGFNFAVPLITLGQIQMISEDLTHVFGQASWFMGIQSTPLGRLKLVNTAQFVMPERYQPDAKYRPTYMISIANCLWALAVDKVNQPISLKPSDVKWRVNRDKQSWLAGVVKEKMCVLIDIPALAKQLMERDRNN